ncbi:MAG: acyl-CoA synthetase FdrA [Bacteroidota bacterium]|nr:acyl-CoA synthetase FdrA [Bacteroidota bacterium]
MKHKIIIKKNSYYDSISLMQLSDKAKLLPNVLDAVISMGTETNKNFLKEINLFDQQLDAAGPNDLVIAIRIQDEQALESVSELIEKLLNSKESSEQKSTDDKPVSFDYTLRKNPDANIVLVSIPGEYAYYESKKGLIADKHVMIFSDNVSIEQEIQLKEMAVSKGLLLMGPDCGTAIINGVPLAFANVVPEGPIGIVGASGTGSQQVSSLIARMGSGITQLIGTGGRDLSEAGGGKMMLLGMKALNEDPKTKVIVLLSKPPAEVVMEKVLTSASKCTKPVVVCFLSGRKDVIEKYKLIAADNLEEAATKAVQLATDKTINVSIPEDELSATGGLAEIETAKMNSNQKYIRGLYAGGTLCDESIIYLRKIFGTIYSNTTIDTERKLADSRISVMDTIIDLGDDEFTKGKAHPMIDPSYRKLRLLNEAKDFEVAVILLDIVLGYGSHEDPAGAMLESIKQAKAEFENRGGYLSVVASVCGTEEDPQVLSAQEAKLKQVGVICMPSNFQAVKLAAKIKEIVLKK